MEWTDAIARAGDLLAPHDPPDADVLALVALVVYVLPDGAPAAEVRGLLGEGRTDLEGEPVGLKDALYEGLTEAGRLVPGDPARDVLLDLTYRPEWAMGGDVPLAMTGGLSRDHSRLYAALPRARALLADDGA